MTLPASGAISLNNVNTELLRTATASINMNDAAVRTLFGVGGSGTAISMSQGWGKSNRVVISLLIGANTKNYNVYANRGGTYVAGKSDITLNNPGYVIGSTSTATYALSTLGLTAGDTFTLVNTGYIAGKGGNAGGNAGGVSLQCTVATTITNGAGYIYGGGGGGAAPLTGAGAAGGGGGGYSQGVGGLTSGLHTYTHGRQGYGGGGGGYSAYGGALGVGGVDGLVSHSYTTTRNGGGGGGGGGASGGLAWGSYTRAPAGLAIQGWSYITWLSGNLRVYGGHAG